MALHRLFTFRFVVFSTFLTIHVKAAATELQAYGCDLGWTNYENCCYKVQTGTVKANDARSTCQSMESSLSSVWSQEEKNFLMSLWQFPNGEVEFVWLGVRGSGSGDWVTDDQSEIKIKQGDYEWSIFDAMPGMPRATSKKCVGLRNSGSVAFLDCDYQADAFVCKKALPKIFITTRVVNDTSQGAGSHAGHVQLFERMLPPNLTSLPPDSLMLAQDVAATEVGCAFRCFSVTNCQVFQVSCQIAKNCDIFLCLLFTGVAV